MKNALILHGTSSSSEGNWFPWLKKELEERGWKVWVPDLPHADKPSIKRYNEFIFGNKEWKFNKDSVLVGHSSGAVAILGLLQHLPENTIINVCILVSGFKDDLGWPSLKELFDERFDYEFIKKRSRKFILIHSDNDPHVDISHAKFLSEKLGGKLIILKGQGHFNLDSNVSYKEFPFLFQLVTL